MIRIPDTWKNNKNTIESAHWDSFYKYVYIDLVEILYTHKKSLLRLFFNKKRLLLKIFPKVIFKNEFKNIRRIYYCFLKEQKSICNFNRYSKYEKIFNQSDKLLINSTLSFLVVGDKVTLNIIIKFLEVRTVKKPDKYTSSDTIDSLFIDIKDLFTKKYEDFRSNWKEWNGYELTKKLGIVTCPYCNRSYISSYIHNKNNENKSKTTAQLDHYFSKTKYPYLIFSLYNLMPCCPTCNHNKLDNEEGLYPYDEDFSSYNVKFRIDDMNLLESNPESINIEISDSNGGALPPNIENSIKAFHLDKIYEDHKLEVNDIRLKWKCYSNEDLLNEIEGIIQTFDSTIDRNKMMDLLYSNFLDKNDHHKKVLSKFTSDIIEYFELDEK